MNMPVVTVPVVSLEAPPPPEQQQQQQQQQHQHDETYASDQGVYYQPGYHSHQQQQQQHQQQQQQQQQVEQHPVYTPVDTVSETIASLETHPPLQQQQQHQQQPQQQQQQQQQKHPHQPPQQQQPEAYAQSERANVTLLDIFAVTYRAANPPEGSYAAAAAAFSKVAMNMTVNVLEDATAAETAAFVALNIAINTHSHTPASAPDAAAASAAAAANFCTALEKVTLLVEETASLFAAYAACVVLQHITGNANTAAKYVPLKDADATLHACAGTEVAGGVGDTDAGVKLHTADVAFVALEQEVRATQNPAPPYAPTPPEQQQQRRQQQQQQQPLQPQQQQHHHHHHQQHKMDECPAGASCAPPEPCPISECPRPDQCPLLEHCQPPDHALPAHPSSSATAFTTAASVSASATDHRRNIPVNATSAAAVATAFCTAVDKVALLEADDATLCTAADAILFDAAIACVVLDHVTGNAEEYMPMESAQWYVPLKDADATLKAAAVAFAAGGVGYTVANVELHTAAVAFVALEREMRTTQYPPPAYAPPPPEQQQQHQQQQQQQQQQPPLQRQQRQQPDQITDVCPACASCVPPEPCPLPECPPPDQCPLLEHCQPPDHAPPPQPSSMATTSTTAASASASATDQRRNITVNATSADAVATAFCTAVDKVALLEADDETLCAAADVMLFDAAIACVVLDHVTGNAEEYMPMESAVWYVPLNSVPCACVCTSPTRAAAATSAAAATAAATAASAAAAAAAASDHGRVPRLCQLCASRAVPPSRVPTS